MSVVLCPADEIGEGQARGFLVGEGAARRDVILLRRGGVVRAYVNSCPHQGTPLETFPDRFLDADGLLVCSTHGARFRVEDGVCVSGPCEGKSLQAIACVVCGENVLVQL
ncbi:MAG: Rieske (2Fe-2S) protein [Burkholderiales bacterium]